MIEFILAHLVPLLYHITFNIIVEHVYLQFNFIKNVSRILRTDNSKINIKINNAATSWLLRQPRPFATTCIANMGAGWNCAGLDG